MRFGSDDADGDFSGVISGSLRLEKTGSNTQVLRGQNSFSEPTFIEAGTLSLFGGVSLPDEMPVFLGDAQLLFNDAERVASIDGQAGASVGILDALTLASDTFDSDFEGMFFGDGTLIIAGGIHRFSGAHTHSGPTVVTDGHLLLSGTTQSALQIGQGARVTANNVIDADVTNAGTLAISAGVNRLRVGGNFVQSAAGQLLLGLQPTTNDQLAVAGTADIDGTISVSIASDQTYTIGTQWTVIDAAGGLDILGNIDLAEIGTFVHLDAATTENQLTIALVRVPYSVAARTPAQSAIADAFQAALTDPERTDAVGEALNALESLSVEDVSTFFSDLSGEGASARAAMARTLSLHVQDELQLKSRRAAMHGGDGWYIWGDGAALQNILLSQTTGEAADVSHFTAGASRHLGATTWAGFAFGYGQADGQTIDDMTALSLAVMAGTQWNAVSLSTTLGYTHLDGPSAALGAGGRSLLAAVQAHTSFQASRVTLRPHASLRFTHSALEEISGQSVRGLIAATTRRKSAPLEARIGVDLSTQVQAFSWRVQPFLRLAYSLLLSGQTDTFDQQIVGLGDFRFDANSYARSGARIGAGAEILATERVSVSLEYLGQLAHGNWANGGALRVVVAF